MAQNKKQLENLKKGKKFTSDRQPSPEAKSEGWKKRRLLRDLADALIEGEQLKELKELANNLGMPLENDEVTLEVAMSLKQVQKALLRGDTKAYNAVLDRLKGKPAQSIDHTSNGNQITAPLINFDTFAPKLDDGGK